MTVFAYALGTIIVVLVTEEAVECAQKTKESPFAVSRLSVTLKEELQIYLMRTIR